MKLEGIHHITAITGDAPRNLDFYTRVLGLRLAAKTVNQDDPSVYHLFYADEQGRPGSELTFFEYPGATPGRAGAGMVHTIVSRVGSPAALDFWEQRLGDEGIEVERDGDALRFADFEGLGHELAVRPGVDEPLAAEHPEVPTEHALQGFDGVRAYSADPDRSRALLEKVLSARPVGDAAWELRGERRGGTIEYDGAPRTAGRQSAGTVHHVAWGTTSPSTRAGSSSSTSRASRTAASSTATTSTRSTSASRAACCSRSPTTLPASRSTCRSTSSGRWSSCRRSSSRPVRDRGAADAAPRSARGPLATRWPA